MLEANVDGAVRDLDTEFLHDLRISVRRTRSGLTLAGDSLPAGLAARFAGEFKWLGDLSTPVRDLDVYLLGLEATIGESGEGEPLQPFRRYLARRRRAERRRLLAGLRSRRFATLTGDWRAALLEISDHSAVDQPTAADLATARITAATEESSSALGDHLGVTGPKTCTPCASAASNCVYLMEYFASLHDPERTPQDNQGTEVAAGLPRAFPGQPDPARGDYRPRRPDGRRASSAGTDAARDGSAGCRARIAAARRPR